MGCRISEKTQAGHSLSACLTHVYSLHASNKKIYEGSHTQACTEMNNLFPSAPTSQKPSKCPSVRYLVTKKWVQELLRRILPNIPLARVQVSEVSAAHIVWTYPALYPSL